MLGNQEPNPRPASYDRQLQIYRQASWSIQPVTACMPVSPSSTITILYPMSAVLLGKKPGLADFLADVDVVMRILL